MPLLQATLTQRQKMDVSYQRYLTGSVMRESSMFKIVYMETARNKKKMELIPVYMPLML
jgi:hypothetical protein